MSIANHSVNNLVDFIEYAFHQHADLPAFSCLGQTLTFAEIDDKSKDLAAWFQQEAHLNPGDRIAIQLPNILQFPIAVYAALRAGLVIVNTNPMYTPREMQHQFADSGAKALVILSDLFPKFEQIASNTSIETTLVTDAADILTGNKPEVEGATAFNDALSKGKFCSCSNMLMRSYQMYVSYNTRVALPAYLKVQH